MVNNFTNYLWYPARVLVLLGCVLAILLCANNAQAQSRTVSGQVTSAENGTPLPGVNVIVRGTTVGTVTDVEGNYRLEVPGDATNLTFTFIGLSEVDVAIENRSTINIQMQEDSQQLSEVVVVGYGTQERRELTGSVASINAEAIENLVTPSFENQLAGRAPGVQVTTTSGVLGEPPVIRIRGVNSISSSSDPLIVIDGVPVISTSQSGIADVNPLSNINPADIESFEILKDGSATAIYGSRAANGVIIITTKRGKAGKAQVDLSIGFGANDAANRFDLLTGDQFVEVVNEKLLNAGSEPGAAPGVNTDWQDYVFRRGMVQNHNLSVRGGSEDTQYFFSLGFSDQQGPILANDLTRYSFRANVDHKVNSAIKLGTSLNYSNTTINSLNNGENSLSGAVLASTRMLPNVPIRDPENVIFDGFNVTPNGLALGSGVNSRGIDNNYPNIAFVLANNTYRTQLSRVQGSAFGEVEIVEGLVARTQIGVDILANDDFLSWDPRHGDGRGYNGYVYQSYRPVNRWNWQNTLNYANTFGADHSVNVTLGYEAQKTILSGFTGLGQDFANRYFQQNNLITGSYAVQQSSGYYDQQGFDSFFGRVNYAYKGKYLLTLTARNDGISALPEQSRRGTFPGGAIGWRVSDEGFWNAGFINDFKLRASYAEVGNTEIGYFPYAGVYGSVLYGSSAGIGFTNVANPDLIWEASKKVNAGFDMSLLNNLITVNFDYFQNNVDNLVLDAPVAQSLGVPGNQISQNIGAMVNRGVELRVQANLIQGEQFRWTTDVNFSYITNEVTRLISPITTTFNRTEEGGPIGALYGVEWAGVNSANGNAMYNRYDAETDEQFIVQYDPEAGSWYEYNEANPAELGEASSAPGSADLRSLGNTLPKWLGGWTNNFSYGNFDAEIFLRYSGGNYIMNETRRGLMGQGFSNNSAEILDRWTTPGQETDVPRTYLGSDAPVYQTGVSNSRFVEKGDFLRVQNIVVGYRVPAETLSGFLNGSFRSIRVFAQVQNPFTITGYRGLDPEANRLNTDGNALQFGVDFNSAPVVRTYSAGLNIGF